jgi:hypothetical protein
MSILSILLRLESGCHKTQYLGSPGWYLAVWGIESSRVTNTMRSSMERVRCSYLNWWHTQESPNLLSITRIKIWILGRDERAQTLDLNEVFCFSEWPTTLWGRWGFIYSPHLKRVIGKIFHRTSLVDFSESRCQARNVRSIVLVWYHHRSMDSLEAGIALWKPATGRISLVPTSGSRWEFLEVDDFIGQVWWKPGKRFLDG